MINVTIPSNGFDLNAVAKPSSSEDKTAILLEQLRGTSSAIRERAAQQVIFTPPIILRNEEPIIRRGTLVGIQGRFGSHKSRAAEQLASLVISNLRVRHKDIHMGYTKNPMERFALAYIDSERNTKEELPLTIQNIRKKAGFEPFEDVADFYYTSIKTVERKLRLEAVKVFLQDLRTQTSLHIFVVLDVLTDCVSDFNDAKDSLALCDFLNNLCEHEDVTILGVIHENPNSDKARGHLGTEFANKASTFFQIGFVRDSNGNDTDVIRLRYLKVRSIKRPESLFITYSAETEGLILAPAEMLEGIYGSNRRFDANDIAELLEDCLSNTPIPQVQLLSELTEKTQLTKNPLLERIKEIEAKGRNWILTDTDGKACYLKVNRTPGKTTTYQLTPIDSEEGA